SLVSGSLGDGTGDVVVERFLDPYGDDVAGREITFPGVRDQEAPVDLGRLRPQPALEQVLVLLGRSLDDRRDLAAAQGAQPPARDRPLEREQEVLPALLLLRRHRIAERLRDGARLRGIGERPDVVELRAAHELAELAELRLPLAGEADDEC